MEQENVVQFLPPPQTDKMILLVESSAGKRPSSGLIQVPDERASVRRRCESCENRIKDVILGAYRLRIANEYVRMKLMRPEAAVAEGEKESSQYEHLIFSTHRDAIDSYRNPNCPHCLGEGTVEDLPYEKMGVFRGIVMATGDLVKGIEVGDVLAVPKHAIPHTRRYRNAMWLLGLPADRTVFVQTEKGGENVLPWRERGYIMVTRECSHPWVVFGNLARPLPSPAAPSTPSTMVASA